MVETQSKSCGRRGKVADMAAANESENVLLDKVDKRA